MGAGGQLRAPRWPAGAFPFLTPTSRPPRSPSTSPGGVAAVAAGTLPDEDSLNACSEVRLRLNRTIALMAVGADSPVSVGLTMTDALLSPLATESPLQARAGPLGRGLRGPGAQPSPV